MKPREIMSLLVVSFFLSTVLFGQDVAFAGSIEEEIRELKARITEPEKKLAEQQAAVAAQEEEIGEQIDEGTEVNINYPITGLTQDNQITV